MKLRVKLFPLVALDEVTAANVRRIEKIYEDLGKTPTIKAGGYWEDVDAKVIVSFSGWFTPTVQSRKGNVFTVQSVGFTPFRVKPTENSTLEFS